MLPPLITELAAGIRSGNLPASGATANFYYPGTFTRAVNVFADDGVTPVLSTTLDSDGRAFVRTAAPVRLVVQDAVGLTVFDHEVPGSAADSCAVQNTFWNGGVKTTLQAILSKLGISIGADGLIKPGATSLGIGLAAWTKGVHIDITGEDAGGGHRVVGDDLTDCTTGIQTALDLAALNGGGVVYIPPGTYRISAPLTISASGVALVGAGPNASIIKNTGAATAVSTTLVGLVGVTVQDLTITHATASAAGTAAIAIVNGTNCTVNRVNTAGHAYGIYARDCSELLISGGTLGTNALAGARPLYLVGTGASAKHVTVIGTKANAQPGESSCEVVGTQQEVALLSASLTGGAYCFEINAAASGNDFRLYGCEVDATTGIVLHGPATDHEFYCDQINAQAVADVAGAGTIAPSRASWLTFRFRAIGATATLGPPTPSIGAFKTCYPQLRIMLHNHDAGTGATTWTVDAKYHLSAAIDTTYDNITSLLFEYDYNSSCWREISRAVTT